MDRETKESLLYAVRDAQRFWRRTRREANLDSEHLYSPDECTERLRHYQALERNLAGFFEEVL
jgi:hypothetical protein